MIGRDPLLIAGVIGFAVMVIALGIAQVIVVNSERVESPIWGLEYLGVWPVIGLASVVALTAIAWLSARAGIVRDRDPYALAPGDEPEPGPIDEPEEASRG